MQIAGICVFFLSLLIYAFFISRDLLTGVKIKNVNIIDGSKVAETAFEITGNAKNAIFITINGREISVDQLGNFKETIALLPGYNIINITAKDKFGDVDEKNYKLIR